MNLLSYMDIYLHLFKTRIQIPINMKIKLGKVLKIFAFYKGSALILNAINNQKRNEFKFSDIIFSSILFLAHLSYAQDELLWSLFVHRPSIRPSVRPSVRASLR